ncbi:unnamed protein product [Rhizopus stolonifer]
MSNSKKKLVQLSNSCYLCDEEYNYATPSGLRGHLRNIHNVSIPGRKITDRRPTSKKYEYTLEAGENIPVHHACCSCFYHTADIERFANHIARMHVSGDSKGKVKEEEDEDGEEEEEEEEDEESNEKNRSITKTKELSADKLAQDTMKILIDGLKKLMK